MTKKTDDEAVSIDDGLTAQQRHGAELAAIGWSNTNIAENVGVRRETVSRWHKLPAFRRVVAQLVDEHRAEQIGYLGELSTKAMAAIEDLLIYSDPNIRLKAAVAVLGLSGLGKAQSAVNVHKAQDSTS